MKGQDDKIASLVIPKTVGFLRNESRDIRREMIGAEAGDGDGIFHRTYGADHADLIFAPPHDFAWLRPSGPLAVPIEDVDPQKREHGFGGVGGNDIRRPIEFVIADRHRLKTGEIHPFDHESAAAVVRKSAALPHIAGRKDDRVVGVQPFLAQQIGGEAGYAGLILRRKAIDGPVGIIDRINIKKGVLRWHIGSLAGKGGHLEGADEERPDGRIERKIQGSAGPLIRKRQSLTAC